MVGRSRMEKYVVRVKNSPNLYSSLRVPKGIWERRGELERLGVRDLKRQETRSLGTSDPTEANRRVIPRKAAWEARMSALESLLSEPPENWTEREQAAFAGRSAIEFLEKFGNNPTSAPDPFPWLARKVVNGLGRFDRSPEAQSAFAVIRGELRKLPFERRREWVDAGLSGSPMVSPRHRFFLCLSEMDAFGLTRWARLRAEAELVVEGVRVDAATREGTERALRGYLEKARESLASFAGGDWSKPAWVNGVPLTEGARRRERKAGTLSFSSLLDRWEREASPTAKTARSYRSRADEFAAFVGHSDARRVTVPNVADWKAALLDRGQSVKTVNDKLAAVGTLFHLARREGRLEANPFANQGVRRKEKAASGPKGYTDDEARKLLLAARREQGWARWWPWVCAYSGMRIGEVGQLRASDVVTDGDGSFIIVDPEAGGLKTRAANRVVPVHDALVREGFVAWAQGQRGRLFGELRVSKDGRLNEAAADRARRWVRRAVPDLPADRKPSHGFRHRFLTLCRQHGVRPDAGQAIVGHALRTKDVTDSYGEFTRTTLAGEVAKIPTLSLAPNGT